MVLHKIVLFFYVFSTPKIKIYTFGQFSGREQPTGVHEISNKQKSIFPL